MIDVIDKLVTDEKADEKIVNTVIERDMEVILA